MNRTNPLKWLLILQTVALLIYTAWVIQNQGGSLFQIYFNDILSLRWNGQFNLDFSCYLLLSGIWIMWRNKFSWASIGLGTVAVIVGIIAFAPYLIYLLSVEEGDLKRVLLGAQG